MILLRALIAAISLLVLLLGTNMWSKDAAAQHIAVPQPMGDTTTVLDGVTRSEGVESQDWADSRVDLNGNEIDNAVGDYRVDRRGDMYERHAPDTALPHLGAPGM
jgi:hypothetical protein